MSQMWPVNSYIYKHVLKHFHFIIEPHNVLFKKLYSVRLKIFVKLETIWNLDLLKWFRKYMRFFPFSPPSPKTAKWILSLGILPNYSKRLKHLLLILIGNYQLGSLIVISYSIIPYSVGNLCDLWPDIK